MCRTGLLLTFILATFIASLSSAINVAAGTETDPHFVHDVSYILDLTVDRTDPSRLLLATRSGLYRAHFDGRAEHVSSNVRALWNVVADPARPNALYGRGYLDKGGSRAIQSIDAGHTWRSLAEEHAEPRFLRSIDISKFDSSVIYGLGSHLWISFDSGQNWTRNALAPSWAIDIATSSWSRGTIYAATGSGLSLSADNGRTWRRASISFCRQPVTAVEAGFHGEVYAFSLCKGLVRLNERTGSWQVIRSDFGGCIIQHLAIDPRDRNKIYAVERCRIVLSSVDGGVTWTQFGSNRPWIPDCPINPEGRIEPGS